MKYKMHVQNTVNHCVYVKLLLHLCGIINNMVLQCVVSS